MPFSLRSIRFLNGRKRAKNTPFSEIGASIPLVAVFQPGDFLPQIPSNTQAIRFYAFCQTKMSGFLNAFFSAQYPFFKRSQAGQKIPRSRKLGPAYPNAGAMTANPWHGSYIVSLCVLCLFSRMRSMKTSKNRVVLCIFSVFLFFSSLLYGILVFFLHHNFFSFPCFIYLFLKYFGHR
jgi:hypothetical protein